MDDNATKMQDLCREVLKELTTTGGVTIHTVHYWKRFYELEELSMSSDDWDSRPGGDGSRIFAREASEKSNAVRPPPLKKCAVEEGTADSSTAPLGGEPVPKSGADTGNPGSLGPLCTVCDMHSNQPGHWRAPCPWYVPQVKVEKGLLRSNTTAYAIRQSN